MKNYHEISAGLEKALRQVRIIPVLALESVDDGMEVCRILYENNLKGAEITFRTAAAADIIKEAKKQFPDMLIGAGTVLNTKDLDKAFANGASFAVAPGFNPKVVSAAISNSWAFAPGVCTPSEVEQAYDLGVSVMKFFPAEAAGGLPMLQSIIAPYKHLNINFMPTGGINADNVKSYLKIAQVAAVGGTWLGKSEDVKNKNFDKIAQAVRDALTLI